MLNKLIKQNNFDWFASSINEDNFPSIYKLYHFNEEISYKKVLETMEKDGYRPANIYELLSWNEWDRVSTVVALGSIAKINPDGHGSPYIFKNAYSGRGISLTYPYGIFPKDDLFLAVNKK